MKKLLADVSPDLLPIWLTDDVENASSLVVDTNGDFGEKGHFLSSQYPLNFWGSWLRSDLIQSGVLNDLFDGSQKSECLLPCVTTHIETKFLNKYASDSSYIDLTFSSEVKSAFENLNFSGAPNTSGKSHNNGHVETFSQYLSFQGELFHWIIPNRKKHKLSCIWQIFKTRWVARWVSGLALGCCKWYSLQPPVHHQSSQDAKELGQNFSPNLILIFNNCVCACYTWF